MLLVSSHEKDDQLLGLQSGFSTGVVFTNGVFLHGMIVM